MVAAAQAVHAASASPRLQRGPALCFHFQAQSGSDGSEDLFRATRGSFRCGLKMLPERPRDLDTRFGQVCGVVSHRGARGLTWCVHNTKARAAASVNRRKALTTVHCTLPFHLTTCGERQSLSQLSACAGTLPCRVWGCRQVAPFNLWLAVLFRLGCDDCRLSVGV